MKRRDVLKSGIGRRRGERAGQAGDRAIGTEHTLATDVIVPQKPRYDLRRRRSLCRPRQQADRRQVQHPGVRGRRHRARVSGARRRAAGHGRDLPHRHLLLRRQGLHDGLRHGVAVRAHHTPAERLDVCRAAASRRSTSSSRSTASSPIPAGNTGAQMGGWFRNPVNTHRRLQGPEDAHSGPRRSGHGAHRCRAAGAARRRHLSGAGARRHRRDRVGRPLRRREARLLQDRQELLLPGLVGAVLDVPRHGQPAEMGRAAEAPTRRPSSAPRARRTWKWLPSTTPRTGWRCSG